MADDWHSLKIKEQEDKWYFEAELILERERRELIATERLRNLQDKATLKENKL